MEIKEMNQKHINDFTQQAFCPHEESRILSQMINIAHNGIQNIFYKKLFETLVNRVLDESQYCLVFTVNGYYDLAVYNWSMLFGAYSEPTHYKKLIEYNGISKHLCQILSCSEDAEKALQNYLLGYIELNDEEYKDFHQKIKDYRDRYLAHREHHPTVISNNDLISPDLNVMKKGLQSLYLLLVKIIQAYPSAPDEKNVYPVSYLLFNSLEDIDAFEKLTVPNFDALLRKIA